MKKTINYNEKQMKLLTLDAAQSLMGKLITTIYFGYRGQDGSDTFTVGVTKSQYILAKNEPCEGFTNRAEYWDSYMTPQQIIATKNTLELLTISGERTHIRLHPENAEIGFTCSDIDRFVYYFVQADNTI